MIIITVAGLIGTCSAPPSVLEQVLDTGELRVVTRDSPTAYTIGPNGPSGPEYDLVQAFADELGVALVVETVDSVSEIMPILIAGDAHMAAAGLSITESRREFLNFGHPYKSVDVHLIYKLGTGKPRSVEDVLDRSIEVVAGSSHVDLLTSLQKAYPELSWAENADVEFAELLTKVAMDDIDLTVADSPDFNIQRHFYPDLRIALDLEIGDPIAWAFPKGTGNSLLARADEFLIDADRSGMLARVLDRYFGHTRKFDYVGTRNFIRHYESRLPRYRAMFEQAGREWGADWRLLAAIGYQESHWRSQAVSPTGVRGLMMLTQDTADYLSIDDRLDPESSIFGGARYFVRQTERVADTVGEPDRTWMALAAYNVGFNHIKDARMITEWQGGNPDSWLDLRKALPLLSQRKWYTRVPYGYARGWEPVLYVSNIRRYYNILKWLTANEEPPESEVLDESPDSPVLPLSGKPEESA
ncbi:MAG: membrane-bound lytic murein transglycosylase MltF [Gammaproteobacteria bacterium]|nr:membrane-bound lytic murein transglycosylase MltF [Gammaproteobacteria bacterium]MBU2678098.1 membrane-bound lytic murein transglycosylase MltF [Gammaproteobacteria bacterium]NNC56146.1 membrane-bound lytic murein transglycosylase MltF [Woeseiaceae bacterium]NNL51833.1 membrane-bound lytic murein transglycosylase MltF [Woeseiaceae bacterium]